jgi:ankyrin repeat protein
MSRCFALRSGRVEPSVHSLVLGASSDGDVVRVRALLSRGGHDAANASNSNLWTPLLFAAESGTLEIVLDLLAAGAHVDHTSNGGWSALMLASERGYVLVVRALITATADVQQADHNGFTGKPSRNMPCIFALRLRCDPLAIVAVLRRAQTAADAESDADPSAAPPTAWAPAPANPPPPLPT